MHTSRGLKPNVWVMFSTFMRLKHTTLALLISRKGIDGVAKFIRVIAGYKIMFCLVSKFSFKVYQIPLLVMILCVFFRQLGNNTWKEDCKLYN